MAREHHESGELRVFGQRVVGSVGGVDEPRQLLTHDLQAAPSEVPLGLSRAGVSGVQKAIRISYGGSEKLIAADIACTVLYPSMGLGYGLIKDAHWATALGQAYYEGCKRLLQQYTELEVSLRQAQHERALTVRVAAIYSVGLGDMGQYVQRFADRHAKAQNACATHRLPPAFVRRCTGCRGLSAELQQLRGNGPAR
jgi:hypothetical protein